MGEGRLVEIPWMELGAWSLELGDESERFLVEEKRRIEISN